MGVIAGGPRNGQHTHVDALTSGSVKPVDLPWEMFTFLLVCTVHVHVLQCQVHVAWIIEINRENQPLEREPLLHLHGRSSLSLDVLQVHKDVSGMVPLLTSTQEQG